MIDRQLPRDVVADDECDLLCPWCRRDCCEATVTLEGLFVAHQSKEVRFAHYAPHDLPDPRALVSTCPNCARPFMVTTPYPGLMRLLAVRTDADAKLLQACEQSRHSPDERQSRGPKPPGPSRI